MEYRVESDRGWGAFLHYRRDRLEYIADAGRRGVDVRVLEFGKRKLVQVNHPDLIEDVLVTHDWNFTKGPDFRASRHILGDGLITSEGELHRRERRIAQQAFQPSRLPAYAEAMVERATVTANRWESGQKLDMHHEMQRLTLEIVGKTLFSADVTKPGDPIGRSLIRALLAFVGLNSPLAMMFPVVRQLIEKKAIRARLSINDALMSVIEERRKSTESYNDMLSLLMESSESGSQGYLSDRLLLDELLTLFLAGHETTATALTWTLYELTQNPEVMERLWAELDQDDAEAPPMERYQRLEYTGWVLREGLRLYPPVWILGRTPVMPFRVGPVEVPAGGTLLMSPYSMQRDSRYWEEPEVFKPERWGPAGVERRPRFAFFPFGAGMRMCIGGQFAMIEGVLLLATLARRWKVTLEPGQRVEMWPQITLRPKETILMKVEKR